MILICMAGSTSDPILSIDKLKHRSVSNVIIMKTNSVISPTLDQSMKHQIG
jgi:hypothetical protein